LLKGLQKVNGEMNLIMFCYNFLRTKNILGFDKMLTTLKNWKPDYKKVSGPLKTAVIKRIYSQNEGSFFKRVWQVFFMMAT